MNYGIHGIPYTIVENHWHGDYKRVWIKSDMSSTSVPRIDVTKVKPVKLTVAPSDALCLSCGSRGKVHGAGCKTQCCCLGTNLPSHAVKSEGCIR